MLVPSYPCASYKLHKFSSRSTKKNAACDSTVYDARRIVHHVAAMSPPPFAHAESDQTHPRNTASHLTFALTGYFAL